MKEKMPDGRVYVVLEQINTKEKNRELEFGLKIVNQKGEELGSNSVNALIATEQGVGLINAKSWIEFVRKLGGAGIQQEGANEFKGVGANITYKIDASEINTWLDGGKAIDEGEWGNWKGKIGEFNDMKGRGRDDLNNVVAKAKETFGKWLGNLEGQQDAKKINSLSNNMKFDGTFTFSNGGEFKVNSEWVSWCGSYKNKREKLLDTKNIQSIGSVEGYKSDNKDIGLRVGTLPSSTREGIWNIIPMRKSIVKIKLDSKNMNNETITGTLEPMKDNSQLTI